jgi:hypothetical protein
LFGQLSHDVYCRGILIGGELGESIAAIKEEWESMNIKVVNRLIMSMQRRLKAVIKAKGGCTKY